MAPQIGFVSVGSVIFKKQRHGKEGINQEWEKISSRLKEGHVWK